MPMAWLGFGLLPAISGSPFQANGPAFAVLPGAPRRRRLGSSNALHRNTNTTKTTMDVKKAAIMNYKVPPALKQEHEELHAQLINATRAGGRTQKAAQKVAHLLHAHFENEEKFALPPLALLAPLSQGKYTPEMKSILPLTDRLKADLPQMLREHQAIVAALKELLAAARQEGKPQHIDFAQKLMLHAQNEEQITYPAAILVGEYLKTR